MRYNINLLSKKELGFLDKAVYFALHYLRYILVITQLVVVCVLFYRFKVDNDIIELKEAINQKQEIIKVTAPLVEEADRIDTQVQSITTSLSSQSNLKEALDYMRGIFPEKASLKNFEITAGAFRMNGFAQDAPTVQAFFNRLKRDNRFSQVALEKMKKEDTGRFSFTMSLGTFK